MSSVSSPPDPCQPIDSQRRANALKQLANTADLLVDSLKSQLPTTEKGRRASLIAAFLTNLARTQAKLFLPPESPAIITDSGDTIIAVSWANSLTTGDPGESSVIRCMRIAAQKMDRHQLDDLGYTLHLIGSLEHFDSPGAIYNFGPSYVHLVRLDGFTSLYEPVAAHFWDEAARKRGVSVLCSAPSTVENNSSLGLELAGSSMTRSIEPSPQIQRHHPPHFLAELSAAWKDRTIPLNDPSQTGIAIDSDEAHELMRSLHKAACQNVIEGGGPFAAAIVSPQGRVLSFGVNQVVAERDAIAHGEVCALREARRMLLQAGPSMVRPDRVLEGHFVVTSSITCISCAEQLGRYGITRLYYDNTKVDIERATAFTEGPLREDFWERTGITIERIPTEDAVRLEPFRIFSQGLIDGTTISYLKDKAR